MLQQVMEETPTVKYHRDTYQDEKHPLMKYECILVANYETDFSK